MTDVIVVALIAAVPATVAAAVGVSNSRKANQIHVLVNSNMTALKSDLAIANSKIEDLEQLVGKMSAQRDAALEGKP